VNAFNSIGSGTKTTVAGKLPMTLLNSAPNWKVNMRFEGVKTYSRHHYHADVIEAFENATQEDVALAFVLQNVNLPAEYAGVYYKPNEAGQYADWAFTLDFKRGDPIDPLDRAKLEVPLANDDEDQEQKRRVA